MIKLCSYLIIVEGDVGDNIFLFWETSFILKEEET